MLFHILVIGKCLFTDSHTPVTHYPWHDIKTRGLTFSGVVTFFFRSVPWEYQP